MKVKFEAKPEYQVLSVSEVLSVPDLAVLRAGTTKILKTPSKDEKPKPLILDFTGVTRGVPEIKALLTSLREFALQEDREISFCGPEPLLGELSFGKTLEAAVDKIKNKPPIILLQEKETALKSKIEKLTAMKVELEKKMATLNQAGGDPQSILRESSNQVRHLKRMEEQIQALHSNRGAEPIKMENLDAKLSLVRSTVKAVLEKEGILGAGTSSGGKK